MKRFVFLALIAWLSSAAAAQPTRVAGNQPAAMHHSDADDARKARLLTAMATWVRQYGEMLPSVPAPDSVSVAGFRQSVKDDAILRDLTTRVEKKLSRQSFEAAPVKQVAEAIELVVKDRYGPRQKAATQLPALSTALRRTLAAKEVVPPVVTAAPTTTTGPKTTEPVAVPGEAPAAVDSPASSGWERGLIGFGLGLLVGALGSWFWFNQRIGLERERIREAVEREFQIKLNVELARLQHQLQGEQEKQRSRAHRSEESPPPKKAKAQPATQSSPPPEPPLDFESLVTIAPLAPEPESERTVELSIAPAPTPERYYAPAPDVPYIEHRKLSREPFDVMPIRLLIPGGAGGTSATYGFSPEADQTRILADGIRNLRAFFDFELPPTEQFSRIETAEPGRLERVGDRWEVRARARLLIT